MSMNKEHFTVNSVITPDLETTRIAIQSKDKNTWFQRDVPGQHLGKEDGLIIQLVLDVIAAETDPAGALLRYQAETQAKTTEIVKHAESTEKRLALTEELGKVAQQNGKIIHVMVLNAVMSKNIAYGTIYKQLVELIPLVVAGQLYHADELFTIEDPNHVEVDGEGKRILVQASKDFTYNGEPVSDFVTGGRLELSGAGVAWKYEGKE